MTFAKKKLPKSQIALEVKLAAEELDKKRPEALAILAKDLRLEGFRLGHIPLAVAEKHLEETAILAEAARLAITETYHRIVRQENLDVIGEPEVQVLKLALGNPLEFRIQVALLPDIIPTKSDHAAKLVGKIWTYSRPGRFVGYPKTKTPRPVYHQAARKVSKGLPYFK